MKKVVFLLACWLISAQLFAQKPLLRRVLWRYSPDSTAQYLGKQENTYALENRDVSRTFHNWNDTFSRFEPQSWSHEVVDEKNRVIQSDNQYFNSGSLYQKSVNYDDAARTVHTEWKSVDDHGTVIESQTDDTFDAAGRLVDSQSKWKNTFNPDWTPSHFSYEYQVSPDGKLIEILSENKLDHVFFRTRLFYDPAISDSIVLTIYEVDTTGSSWKEFQRDSFFYDQNRRLIRYDNRWHDLHHGQTFEWQPDGRLRSHTRTYDDLTDSRDTTITRFEYDAEGQERVSEQSSHSFYNGQEDFRFYRKESNWSPDGLLIGIDHFYDNFATSLDSVHWQFSSHGDYIYDDPRFAVKNIDFALQMQPNPTDETLFFSSDSFFGQPVEWKISDAFGHVLQTGNSDGNARQFDADVAGWSPGVYYLTVWLEEAGGKKSFPFLVGK